ncbi:hypothetical protein F5144DRAFT_85647 [Chaetomium tenue]|uniref:Uncharacterized protein n=2 Tax=Chaetomium tenue TaxID=1854479 RepID=A0ACB7PI78_9PEZI|nr:hypothetical protein F5144DRAFT_649762 [Chaetomium globosum]KAH6640101.1 hypothetical protein F5144DRAFT_85647 [Chaetomium globosum]
MAGDSKSPGTGTRGIKDDIIAKLDETALPSLKNFFEGLQVEVMGSEATVDLIENMQKDTDGRAFLKMIDDVVSTQNSRYNNLNNNLNKQASEAEVTISNLRAAVTAGNTELNNYKEALNRTRVERDTWEKAATKIRTSGSGDNDGPNDRDGSIPHPAAFTGDEKDTAKRTSQFRTWQTRVMGRWVSRPQEFNTEGKKIIYASALLEGSAATGVFTGVQKVTANPSDSATWPWETATDFMDHLARKYATMDLAADAENKLRSLSQKDEFAAFSDFLTEYTNLTDVCDWDGTARVRGFRERLSKRMREALNMQINTPERNDFEGWVKMAQTLAINMEGEDHLRKAASNNNGSQNRSNSNGGKAEDPDAMDLDQMRINLAKIPEEEKLRRANDGLCFNCGKAGHQARQCRRPTYPGRSGRGGSRGGGQRGGYGGAYNSQGYSQGYYNPQQGGDNNYFGGAYQQKRALNGPGNNANTGNSGNYQGPPTRRGEMRGDFRGGRNPQVRFLNVQNPGHVVGEVDSEDGWSGDGQPTTDYEGRSEDRSSRGNA